MSSLSAAGFPLHEKERSEIMQDECRIAAAYIRVSTEDQVELSPASQLVEIRKWADKNGWSIPDEYIFVDEGISGRKVTGRDAFRQLIGMAKTKPKPFDAILLWKFSRFARNREDAVFYKSVLRKQLHIDVISISEPIIEGKLGILMEALIEAMDEYYSINLAEEVKRGMEEKHRRGELQAPPSFGYCVQDHLLVRQESEAAYVKEIFRRFCNGEGSYQIARWLNEAGVRTHRGNPFENRTIDYILQNPVYIGKLRWNPSGISRRDFLNPDIVLADGKHEPLIDLNTWKAAQNHIAKAKAMKTKHSHPTQCSKEWISGLIRCSACGATMVFVKPNYWKCNNYVRGKCKISQHISSVLLKDALLRRLQMDLDTSIPLSYDIIPSIEKSEDTCKILKLQHDALSKRLVRLREAYLGGADSIEEYTLAKEHTQQRIERVLAQMEQAAKKAKTSTHTTAAMKKTIQTALNTLCFDQSTMDQKYEAAHCLIDHAVWSKSENLLEVYYRSVF